MAEQTPETDQMRSRINRRRQSWLERDRQRVLDRLRKYVERHGRLPRGSGWL